MGSPRADDKCRLPDAEGFIPCSCVIRWLGGHLIANDLTAPRGIIFDTEGGLLVIDKGVGIVRYMFNDGGNGCLTVSQKTNLVNYTGVRR